MRKRKGQKGAQSPCPSTSAACMRCTATSRAFSSSCPSTPSHLLCSPHALYRHFQCLQQLLPLHNLALEPRYVVLERALVTFDRPSHSRELRVESEGGGTCSESIRERGSEGQGGGSPASSGEGGREGGEGRGPGTIGPASLEEEAREGGRERAALQGRKPTCFLSSASSASRASTRMDWASSWACRTRDG